MTTRKQVLRARTAGFAQDDALVAGRAKRGGNFARSGVKFAQNGIPVGEAGIGGALVRAALGVPGGCVQSLRRGNRASYACVAATSVFLSVVLGIASGTALAQTGAGAATAKPAASGTAPSQAAGTATPDVQQQINAAPERVEVTAYRSPVAALESPVSTRLLNGAALRQAAPVSLDGKLRTVAGFDLFRRSSSLVANPTTEGVSLRGLGSTAASRTLVLLGDVPLNDPYGGWVHWEELPSLAIGEVEVVRGGVSDLYGSSAVGGVVQITPVPLLPTDAPAPAGETQTLPLRRACSAQGNGGVNPAVGQPGALPELVLESGYGAEGQNENGARVRGALG